MKKILLSVLCLFCSTSQAEIVSVYFSKIAKTNNQSTFLHRFARNNSHIILTRAPHLDSEKYQKLKLDTEQPYFIMDHYPLSAHEHASFEFEGVSLYEGKIPHDVDHHGMIRLNFEESQAPRAIERSYGLQTNFVNEKIDSVFLEDMLYKFAGELDFETASLAKRIPERGSEAAKRTAREFLTQEYTKLGYETELHEFKTFWQRGVNVIAKKFNPNNDKTIILSSHYDSMNNKGADDNGAGTIANLAIAKALKDVDLNFNILFVAFDLEEKGLIGSKAYVKHLQDKGELSKIAAVINIEMLGYDSDDDGAVHVIHCNENSSRGLYDAYWKSTRSSALKLLDIAACTNRSDHAPFWQKNVPAIVISQNFFGGDGNPCYHKQCDDVSIVNWNYINQNTQAILNLVTSLRL